MSAHRQLALPFAHDPELHEADFIAAPSNAAARAWLERSGAWPERRLCLWGEAGGGKSHLLRVWARREGAAWREGPGLRGLPGLPVGRALVVDDADAPAEERALLHLLNAAAEAGLPVLLAGRAPPARWNLALPDLASRVRAITAVGLGAADDELLVTLLARLAADRQLALPNGLGPWLLARLPRTPGCLREAVARLDRAALASGGKLTRGLAAAVLAELLEPVARTVSDPAGGSAGRFLPGPSLL